MRFKPSKDSLRQTVQRHNLSARDYTRILKVARTIADLDNAVEIDLGHLGGGDSVPEFGDEERVKNECRPEAKAVRLQGESPLG